MLKETNIYKEKENLIESLCLRKQTKYSGKLGTAISSIRRAVERSPFELSDECYRRSGLEEALGRWPRASLRNPLQPFALS